MAFRQVWTTRGTPPGPAGVDTLAFAFDTPARPTTALSHPRSLVPGLLYPSRRFLRIVEPAPLIGDQAVLMRKDRTILGLHVSVGVVVWRSGAVLGIVIATSLTRGDATARAAVRLAALQQERIANPTPLRPPVNDDRFVLLDDPTLKATVMWLGEQLPARGGFPALDLRATDQTIGLFTPPQLLIRLIYGTPRLPHTVKVALWRSRGLHRLLRRRIPPYVCQRRFDADAPRGRAWIVETLRREPRRANGRCPHSGGDLTAIAFFNDVAVTIDASSCCRSRSDPYDSRPGLRTLLRTLRPRPLPTP